MSGLWTVIINRLQKVSKFDKHGKKVSEEITRIPVTLCDLPYSTALMYQNKAPGETTIVQQIHETASSKRFDKEKFTRTPYSGEPVVPEGLGSEELEFEREMLEAAKSGDFGAALTAEMEATK